MPEGNWNVYINGEKAGTQALASFTDGTAVVEPVSAMVLVKEDAAAVSAPEPADTEAEGNGMNTGLVVGIAAAAAAVCAGGVFVATRNKRKTR